MRRATQRGGIALAVTTLVASGLLASGVPAAQAADAPVANRDTYAADTGQPISIAAPGVLANDVGLGPGYRARLLDTDLNIGPEASLELYADGMDHEYSVAAGGVLSVSAPGLLEGSRNPQPSAPADVATTTTLTGPATLFYGEPAGLTATITPTVAGGTVAFADAGTTVAGCDAVPVTASIAACTADTALEPGGHSFTASYSGTAGALPSTSAPVTVTVSAAPTALTYTGDTSGTIGSPLQVSAQLTNAADGATGPIPGESMVFGMANGLRCTAVTDAAGTASCTLIPNRAGNLAVTVYSGGDDRYQYVQIDGVAAVSEQASTTTVQAAPNPAPWGEDVTLTATVPTGATGTVAFDVAGTQIPGCAAVPVTGDGADCISDGLDVGSQQVTATYSGDENFTDSSGTTTVQVNQRAVEIAYSGPTTGVVGAALALSATATDTRSGEPVTGLRVDLSFQGLGCGGNTDASGVAGCNVFLRRAGTSDATLTFAGDAHYAAATGSGEVTIDRAYTSTATTSDVTDPDFTEPITITANVRPADGGTVSFNDGGAPLADCGAVLLIAGSGSADPWTATCTTTALTAGHHSLEAIYSGTDNYSGSAGSTTVIVHPAPTTLTYTGETAGTVGGSLPVSAFLTNTAGVDPLPVAGQTVEFGWGELTCTSTTGDDGTAACELPITAVAQAGELTATFAGTTEYTESSATADISIDPAETSISYLGDTDATVGTPLEVSAGLVLAQQTAATPSGDGLRGARAFLLAAAPATPDLAGLRLLFTLGSAQCEAITDADGVASCSLTATAAGDRVELTIAFAGTADLTAAELAVPITVAAAPVQTTPPTSAGPTSPGPAGADPAAPVPPSAGGLATTGLTVGGWLAAGLVLFSIGVLLVLAGRFGPHRAERRLH